jgi:hypothetical protein
LAHLKTRLGIEPLDLINKKKSRSLRFGIFLQRGFSKIQGREWAFGDAEARLQVGGSTTVAPAE